MIKQFKDYCIEKGIKPSHASSVDLFMNENTFKCVGCSKKHSLHRIHYETEGQDKMCQECGEDTLFTCNFTQYLDYPYIDGQETFDGTQYEGEQWRQVDPNKVRLRIFGAHVGRIYDLGKESDKSIVAQIKSLYGADNVVEVNV